MGLLVHGSWLDLLVLNGYRDSTGGEVNALAFTKNQTQKILHYRADQEATAWGDPKEIAYTDSNITGSAAKLTTPRKINNVLFDGSKDIEIEAPTKKWTTSITTKWSGSSVPYTQTVAIDGLKDTDIVNVYPIWSSTMAGRKKERAEWVKLNMVETQANGIKFTCDEDKPSIVLNILVEKIS